MQVYSVRCPTPEVDEWDHNWCECDGRCFQWRFEMTCGKITTKHQVMCHKCGHIAPWESNPKAIEVRCPLCGYIFIVRGIKNE